VFFFLCLAVIGAVAAYGPRFRRQGKRQLAVACVAGTLLVALLAAVVPELLNPKNPSGGKSTSVVADIFFVPALVVAAGGFALLAIVASRRAASISDQDKDLRWSDVLAGTAAWLVGAAITSAIILFASLFLFGGMAR
jgi:hypothetical protein